MSFRVNRPARFLGRWGSSCGTCERLPTLLGHLQQRERDRGLNALLIYANWRQILGLLICTTDFSFFIRKGKSNRNYSKIIETYDRILISPRHRRMSLSLFKLNIIPHILLHRRSITIINLLKITPNPREINSTKHMLIPARSRHYT